MATGATNPAAVHQVLVLSKEVLIAGHLKLLVAQPFFKSQNNGWKDQNGTWREPTHIIPCMHQSKPPTAGLEPIPGVAGALPCLFNLSSDSSETTDLSATHSETVMALWAQLNHTALTQRDCQGWSYKGTPGNIPGPTQPDGSTSCSPPELLGPCNNSCAANYWSTRYGRSEGPTCDVPTC